jgi:hypothetical protein
MVRAFTLWFVLEKRLGIGVTVPPSAAEPWISQQPHLLGAMEVPHERHVSPTSTM